MAVAGTETARSMSRARALLLLQAVMLSLTHGVASEAVSRGCGGWLMSSGGWRCYRLAHNYELYYRVANDTLLLGLDVWPTNASGLTQLDWIGIGISEAGGMPGADIAVLTRNTSSPRGWDLWDMFAPSFARPEMDAQQDKTLLSVQERANGRVRARLSFPLTSCDQRQDRPVRPGLPSYVIYAFGEGDFEYHGTRNRGDVTITLAPEVPTPGVDTTSTAAPTAAPAAAPTPRPTPRSTPRGDVRSMDIVMPGITIPTRGTDPYICMDFELPGTLDQPFHLIEFDTVERTSTGPSQDRYVHHAVLYNCTSRPATFGSGTYDCAGSIQNCSTFVLVSAKSEGTTFLPEAAGFRMGAGAMRYVVLQVHYNNVKRDTGLIDNSGFRIRYTPHLRPHDMGVLTMGMENFRIPARSNWSTGQNICPSACTRRFRQPITLVSNLLHMHQIGTGMSVQHFRQLGNGNASNSSSSSGGSSGSGRWVEMEPVGVRRHYHFNFQPFTAVPHTTTTVLPGDVLATTCNYTNPYNYNVSMGHRSSDEMCLSFVMYYPLHEISNCMEWPALRRSGVVLCLGRGDGDIEAGLRRLSSLTAAQQQALILDARARSVLVMRDESIVTSALPWAPQLPSTCRTAPAPPTLGNR